MNINKLIKISVWEKVAPSPNSTLNSWCNCLVTLDTRISNRFGETQ